MRARIAATVFVTVCTLFKAAPAPAASLDCEAMSRAVRAFVARKAPKATAAQAASYGLLLPQRFDPARPLVVLVHGLDCSRYNWHDIAVLLDRDGYQVAYFTYPSDEPIAESAALLESRLVELRAKYPRARVNLIAHSMGGLVCRAYVEGPNYAGGVDRLIMLGPPNHGSGWARVRFVSEAWEHYHLWRQEPKWSPSWMITDGLGEAGRDMKPGSRFLKELNARPRREGVKYTIIAGTQSSVRRVTASCLGATANVIRGRAAGWWGFRQCKNGLNRSAQQLCTKPTDCDGPVKVESARLAGVDDFVLVQSDHAGLQFASRSALPGAWETVRDRLAR
jgi:pimeloyl-ACP methyl ester carboxylesterase